MIVNESFICGHIPRTGGDAAATYFRVFSDDLDLQIDGQSQHLKHRPFSQFTVSNHTLALTIRRLSSWMLSYVQMLVQTGIYPDYRPCSRPSIADIVDPNSSYGLTHIREEGLQGPLATIADRYLIYFTSPNYKVDHYLRMEHLKEDIITFVSKYINITEEHRAKLDAVKTKGQMRYNHSISYWWEPDIIKQIYSNNPIWTTIEQRVYADDGAGK